jgi:hypothetical protein
VGRLRPARARALFSLNRVNFSLNRVAMLPLTGEDNRAVLHVVGARLRRSPMVGDVGVYLDACGRLKVVWRSTLDQRAVLGMVTRMFHDARAALGTRAAPPVGCRHAKPN